VSEVQGRSPSRNLKQCRILVFKLWRKKIVHATGSLRIKNTLCAVLQKNGYVSMPPPVATVRTVVRCVYCRQTLILVLNW